MNDILAGTRVLAVDDDPDALELVARILEGSGAVVSTASSAHQALTLLTGPNLVDVMVCDVGMPSMDGNTFMAMLRRSPTFARLPALAYTAQVTPQERRASLDAGFSAHLEKAAAADVLVSTVKALVEPARAARPSES